MDGKKEAVESRLRGLQSMLFVCFVSLAQQACLSLVNVFRASTGNYSLKVIASEFPNLYDNYRFL